MFSPPLQKSLIFFFTFLPSRMGTRWMEFFVLTCIVSVIGLRGAKISKLWEIKREKRKETETISEGENFAIEVWVGNVLSPNPNNNSTPTFIPMPSTSLSTGFASICPMYMSLFQSGGTCREFKASNVFDTFDTATSPLLLFSIALS